MLNQYALNCIESWSTNSRSFYLEGIGIFLSPFNHSASTAKQGGLYPSPMFLFSRGINNTHSIVLLYSQEENNVFVFLKKRKFSLCCLIHCHGQENLLWLGKSLMTQNFSEVWERNEMLKRTIFSVILNRYRGYWHCQQAVDYLAFVSGIQLL